MLPLIVSIVESHYHPRTQEMIDYLRFREDWGYRCVIGSRGVDRTRSHAASVALAEHSEEWWLWCDADNWVEPAQVAKLVETAQERDLDVLAAIVPTRRTGAPAPNYVGVEQRCQLGMGVVEAQLVSFALTVTHRRVFERVAAGLDKIRFGDTPGYPFFLPLLQRVDDEWHTELGEDYSFALRASRAGCKLHVDTDCVACHAYTDGVVTPEDLMQSFTARAAAQWQASLEYD